MGIPALNEGSVALGADFVVLNHGLSEWILFIKKRGYLSIFITGYYREFISIKSL